MAQINVYILNDHLKGCFDLNKTQNELCENKIFLIFDIDEAMQLRQNKILGQLIGMSMSLTINDSKSQFSLPLQLSYEEIGILIECCEFKVVFWFSCDDSENDESKAKLDMWKKDYETYLSLFSKKQNEDFSKTRNEQLVAIKDKILDGKKKKLMQQIDKLNSDLDALKSSSKNTDLNDEIKKLEAEIDVAMLAVERLESDFELELESNKQKTFLNKDSLNTEIFFKTPSFYKHLFKEKEIPKEVILSDEFYSTCKYKTFKYFWRKGYYLTSGAKFGGDYLVYPDNPSSYHSQYIVVCIEGESKYNSLSLKELITYARMGTCVKKTFVLACLVRGSNNIEQEDSSKHSNKSLSETYLIDLGEGNKLSLISINWSHL